MSKLKIVTIGGGNGQSNLLDALYRYGEEAYEISSIVSMSDDGRTTGELMKKFQDELGLHLPPPGDLRRCLFMMSSSPLRDEFQQYLETVIERDIQIFKLTIGEYFTLVGADDNFLKRIHETEKNILDFKLPLNSSIKGHKVGNILMANLYYNLDKDYNSMLSVMHKLLDVKANIIPVTTKKAYIKAILGNGEVIESQDRISNVASYTSGIADLRLMEDSKNAYQHRDVFKVIKKADYIIISPGDLFTSTISNFVVGGVSEVIKKSDAKIIYIGNSTNKGGETQGLTCLDFVNTIERFLGRRIDVYLCNNKKLDLSKTDRERFQSNVSVKGGDFLYLSDGEKSELERRNIRFLEADLLDRESFYKHDKKSLVHELKKLLT
ncbi:2-phospho-L-lactate transferase CofD family protein [Candidatus Gracilibacteria bacterium]|nr:2-phospho-L-lactate transferase CofD family protein [Candidatus Gracilibacteria bacterium]